LPPLESLAEAQRLIDLGRPFHAHEVLEGTWKAAPEGERDLWQGLAQLAVGLTHALRGNPTGAVSVVTRGRDKIAAYAEAAPYDVDITGLVAWSNQLLERLDRAGDSPSDAFRSPKFQVLG
jgi:predicted metal-dependent hydrolase